MLEINNVHAHYGMVHAVQGVSLKVNQGETVAVLGANGAGKTTLMNMVMGVVTPTSGEVKLMGKSIANVPPHQICKQGVGYVPEGRRVFTDLSIYENLAIGAYTVRKSSDTKQNLEQVYELFPVLKERRKQLAGTLSGGEQQMLAMGRALMSSPKLLLLDEPSLGLAPLVIEDIFHTLQEINARGITVLLVEQSAYLALKVAHRAYILESGQVSVEGDAAELKQSESIRKAYFGG
jgi:branched-chain amino acid transport system ATP-binding protein